jgi:NADP-dependent 3-hydroxy acid dehydrogenase YdfG
MKQPIQAVRQTDMRHHSKSLVVQVVNGVACEVADPDSIDRTAKTTYAAFGNVHVICNNAGVAAGSGIDNITLDTWRWVLDVNLMGVLPNLPPAYSRPWRRRPHRQHRIYGRFAERARI